MLVFPSKSMKMASGGWKMRTAEHTAYEEKLDLDSSPAGVVERGCKVSDGMLPLCLRSVGFQSRNSLNGF